MINAPSIVLCDFLQFDRQLNELMSAGIDFVHVDVMDGSYVPNFALTPDAVKAIKSAYPSLTVDVHLMVDEPARWIDRLADAGADYLSFHIDAVRFARRTLGAIRERGMKAGVVINPSQRIDVVTPYLDLLDHVVLMTVEPGFAGQTFIPGSLERIGELAEIRKAVGKGFLIEVDGGLTYDLSKSALARGADILVTGVFITFGQPEGIPGAVRRFDAAMRSSAPSATTKPTRDRP